jgi:hypothetical protein
MKKKDAEKPKDDFQSVARRLECDPDLDKFDTKLKKIVKAKPRDSKPGK